TRRRPGSAQAPRLSHQPQLRRRHGLEERPDVARRLSGDQLSWRFLVPVAGKIARVGLLSEAAAEEGNNADVAFAADHTSCRLHVARHAGNQVGELESAAVLLVVVALEQLLL